MAYLSYASAMPRGSPATMAATTSPSSMGFTLVRSTPAGQRDRHNALIATGQVRWDVSDRGASASAGGRRAGSEARFPNLKGRSPRAGLCLGYKLAGGA